MFHLQLVEQRLRLQQWQYVSQNAMEEMFSETSLTTS